MVYYDKTFKLEADARKWGNGIYKDYNPYGYGTILFIEQVAEGWRVYGHRAASCD